MYFASRMQAGRMLASQVVPKYQGKDCVVVALDDGGVMVGAQIASQLHCALTMILSAEIKLPLEPEAIAGITPSGSFAYNSAYSSGEIEELATEYRGLIEQEKLNGMHDMNRLLGKGGVIEKKFLKGHNIILVSEGLKSSFPLDLADQFLKPIAMERLVVATPLASVPAVDRMHVMADDIFCLDVVADYLNTDHYYDEKDVPTHEKAVETIEKLLSEWQQNK